MNTSLIKNLSARISMVAPILGCLAGSGERDGRFATRIISGVLGVHEDPEAIDEALRTDPLADSKLREFEEAHKEELYRVVIQSERLRIEQEARLIQTVKSTIIAEIREGGWSAFWRPFWGVVSAISFGIVCIFICVITYRIALGGKPEEMNLIPQFISAMAFFFGIPGAILGVTAWHRGKRQRIEAGEK
jgi:hypothetical protein